MYYCQLCSYRTENRNQIEYHHIIPKENNGEDGQRNQVFLCPNCHKKVYIENSRAGIHSIKNNNSIIIS